MHLLKTKIAGVGAIGAALLMAAGPALAAPPYTVVVGSSTSGDHAITAAATVQSDGFAVHFQALDPSAGLIDMDCTSSTASGVVHAGSGVNPVADITAVTFGGCQIPGGAATVTATNPDTTSSLPWPVNGTGSATSAATDDIAGRIDDVAAHVALTASPSICSFDVSGFATGDFDESSQTLNVSDLGFSDLTLSNVGPCLGQLHDGDPATFEASYPLTSPDGLINAS